METHLARDGMLSNGQGFFIDQFNIISAPDSIVQHPISHEPFKGRSQYAVTISVPYRRSISQTSTLGTMRGLVRRPKLLHIMPLCHPASWVLLCP